MDRELRRLRSRVVDAPKDASGHRRFDDELRDEVVAYARGRISSGESQSAVARELGLAPRVLWRWLRGHAAPLREVVVEDLGAGRAHRNHRLVLRSGVEIVGLELDDLITLARALA